MTWQWSTPAHSTTIMAVALLVAGSACASNPGRHAHQTLAPAGRETAATPPGPEYSWGTAHRSWDSDTFQRNVGGWAVPSGYYAWIAGSWQQNAANNWVYIEGHWQ